MPTTGIFRLERRMVGERSCVAEAGGQPTVDVQEVIMRT